MANIYKLHIDLESFSSVDIKKYGAYKYVDSPDFEILLFAYALHTDPVVVLDMHIPSERAEAARIATHWLNHPNYQKYAHNATFEILCLTKYFKLGLDLKQWRCTAVIAAELGLPRALGELTAYLKFDQTKAKKSTGMALIRYFCCPVKPSAANNWRTRNRPSDDPVKWQEFKEYCGMDVEAEREVDRRLESLPVTDAEWAMWRLDHEINVRGMKVDLPFVEAAISLGEEMKDKFFAEAVLLTGLNNPNSVAELKKWMEKEIEEELPDMTKGTIKKLLKKTQPGDADRMLTLRQELSKTSLKKFDALKGAVCSDERIKGTLLFYGAQRTGRWAGRVFQPQNLPQNHLSDLEGARWLVEHADTETIEMLYDSISDTLSQLIRTAIVPKEGKKFIVVDFSAVEARNIAWYADEEWRLEVFRTHGKIYEASAAAAFHVPMESIDKHSPLRQQGKVLELACGYGGGAGAVGAMDRDNAIPEKDRKPMVYAWRDASPKIVQMWWDIGGAAEKAVRNPRMLVTTKYQGVSFIHEKGFLFMNLPSGRRLAYPKPLMMPNPRFGGEMITFEGKNQYTNKWERLDTYGPKLVENMVQATCRDLLAYGMMELDKEGFETVMHVHDEAVVECDPDVEVEYIEKILARKPDWALTMPHRADGFETYFYKKD